MSQLRVAVVGAGNLGRIHAKLLGEHRGVNLVAVADPSPEACDRIAETIDTKTISDYQDLIGHIDAAIIATPTRFHHQVASDLLGHGIHTLIEKPITDSVSTANDIVSLADRTGCIVQVGHVERFNPAFETAISKIGTPKFIQASRTSTYTFRSTDIGVVHDLMIHDIDLVNSIVGGSLVDTRAIGFSMFGGNEDMAQARLQFSCGAVANLTASRSSFSAERSMQIFGTDGFAKIDFTESKVTFVRVPSWMKNREVDFFNLSEPQKQFVRETLFDNVLPMEEVVVERNNAILQEQADFIAAIRDNLQPRVPAIHGALAVEVAQSVIDSIASHQWQPGTAASSGPLPMVAVASGTDAIPDQLFRTPGQVRRAA
ncbi:Gfo/Idh/MocA family oxidoreductase [Mariniblastus fucicola]|uniref:Dehydrogenase n=1 Tax=Mariniblastus fucicola TaxID=980251 RepID=A0A5B9PF41_9BACT|nr:Gfo/Idh/MocA family oxidoreductase [Mariniblastus fucicola]QEG24159.1 Dehydrogenase [Mariniblastus fucicola]